MYQGMPFVNNIHHFILSVIAASLKQMLFKLYLIFSYLVCYELGSGLLSC